MGVCVLVEWSVFFSSFYKGTTYDEAGTSVSKALIKQSFLEASTILKDQVIGQGREYFISLINKVFMGEISQRVNAQALLEFRQSMMEDMNNLWQSVIMHPPPLQPGTLSPLLPVPPPTPST